MENQGKDGREPPDDFWFPVIYEWSLVVLATLSSDINVVKKHTPADSVYLFSAGRVKDLHMAIILKVTSWLMTSRHYIAIQPASMLNS